MRFIRLKEDGKIVTTPIIAGSPVAQQQAYECEHEWRDMAAGLPVPPAGGGMDECVKCIAVRFTFIKSQWNELVNKHTGVDFNKITETLSQEEYQALVRQQQQILNGGDEYEEG